MKGRGQKYGESQRNRVLTNGFLSHSKSIICKLNTLNSVQASLLEWLTIVKGENENI